MAKNNNKPGESDPPEGSEHQDDSTNDKESVIPTENTEVDAAATDTKKKAKEASRVPGDEVADSEDPQNAIINVASVSSGDPDSVSPDEEDIIDVEYTIHSTEKNDASPQNSNALIPTVNWTWGRPQKKRQLRIGHSEEEAPKSPGPPPPPPPISEAPKKSSAPAWKKASSAVRRNPEETIRRIQGAHSAGSLWGHMAGKIIPQTESKTVATPVPTVTPKESPKASEAPKDAKEDKKTTPVKKKEPGKETRNSGIKVD
jgi:hypothetical protein